MLSIEVDKSYRTREGKKLTVIAKINSKDLPVVAVEENGYSVGEDRVVYLTENGTFYKSKRESQYDIVSEWVETIECERWANVFVDAETGKLYISYSMYDNKYDAESGGKMYSNYKYTTKVKCTTIL